MKTRPNARWLGVAFLITLLVWGTLPDWWSYLFGRKEV